MDDTINPRDLQRLIASEKETLVSKRTGYAYSRRKILSAAAMVGLLPSDALARIYHGGAASYKRRRRLDLSPPDVTGAQIHFITDANAPNSWRALSSGNHVFIMPRSALKTQLSVRGDDVAQNIVLIGGEIRIDPVFDPETMRMLSSGEFAIYDTISWVGATGGTFSLRLASSTWYAGEAIRTISGIPYDVTADGLKTLINAALKISGQPDPCLTVEGTGIGGPFKVVPNLNAALGVSKVIDTGLTGSPTIPATITVSDSFRNAFPHSIERFGAWTGNCLIQGLYCSSPWGADAFNAATLHGDAILQLADCHFRALFNPCHRDRNHPDGAQMYAGPARLYAQNCDFISNGGNGIIGQPRSVTGLEKLYDWRFKDCQFRVLKRDSAVDPYIPDINTEDTAVYIAAGWPAGAPHPSDWTWVMENCFANRFRTADPSVMLTDRGDDAYVNYNVAGTNTIPSGITLRAAPNTSDGYFCSIDRNECGIRYDNPGYTWAPLPTVTQRLNGNAVV